MFSVVFLYLKRTFSLQSIFGIFCGSLRRSFIFHQYIDEYTSIEATLLITFLGLLSFQSVFFFFNYFICLSESDELKLFIVIIVNLSKSLSLLDR